jgi:hypothetical protein
VKNIRNTKVLAVSGGVDNENRNIVVENKNGKTH